MRVKPLKVIKQSLIALVASSMSVASVAAPIVLYGKVNISAQSTDEGGGRFTELKSNNSRLGVKGNLELDNELEVLYVAEWKVDYTDESGSDNFTARNQYVGLKGGFGKLLLGRNDTVLKQSQGKIDQFNHYEADLKGLWQGENRMGDSVTYFSPELKGFTFGVSYVAQDDLEGKDGQSFSLVYGDKNLKKNQWYAAVAADFDMNGYDTQRVSVQTKFGSLKLGAILHNQESVATGLSKDGAMVSVAYSMGEIELKGQFQAAGNNDSVSVGVDYNLGKSTKAFAWITSRSLQESEDNSWLAVGIEHKF